MKRSKHIWLVAIVKNDDLKNLEIHTGVWYPECPEGAEAKAKEIYDYYQANGEEKDEPKVVAKALSADDIELVECDFKKYTGADRMSMVAQIKRHLRYHVKSIGVIALRNYPGGKLFTKELETQSATPILEKLKNKSAKLTNPIIHPERFIPPEGVWPAGVERECPYCGAEVQLYALPKQLLLPEPIVGPLCSKACGQTWKDTLLYGPKKDAKVAKKTTKKRPVKV